VYDWWVGYRKETGYHNKSIKKKKERRIRKVDGLLLLCMARWFGRGGEEEEERKQAGGRNTREGSGVLIWQLAGGLSMRRVPDLSELRDRVLW
jgi:hypothetical protein